MLIQLKGLAFRGRSNILKRASSLDYVELSRRLIRLSAQLRRKLARARRIEKLGDTNETVFTVGDFGAGPGFYSDNLNIENGIFSVAYDANDKIPLSRLVRHLDLTEDLK